MTMNAHMRSIMQFTLIELLVVVAVISILMALLLPALNSAKQRGQDLSCKGNLKQMGLAAAVYSNDFNEWCVSGYPGGVSVSMWPKAFTDLEYIKPQKTFNCPSEPIFAFTSARVNYGINYYTFGAWPGHNKAIPQKIQSISKFGRDSSLVYFVDTPPTDYTNVGVGFGSDCAYFAIGVGVYPISSAGKWYPVYARHNLKMNAAIFDGHVESLSGTGSVAARCQPYWNPSQYASPDPGTLRFALFTE